MYKLLNQTIALVSLSLLGVFSAQATITGGAVTGGYSFDNGGQFVLLSVPFDNSTPDNTVGNNNFNDLNLYGFDEDQNILLDADLNVDILASTGVGGIVASGSTVASHYIGYDPAGSAARRQIGTITFDSEIYGVITRRVTLNNSDFLANTGVSYETPSLRGLESGDKVTIIDPFTLEVDWAAGSPGDYIRVLTNFSPGAEPVPLPAPILLFASALMALFPISKFRR